MTTVIKVYAGIGSRSTPPVILASMATIAANLAAEGWLLRSGHADGADKAFEQGCDDVGGSKEIWLPWRGFNGSKSELFPASLSVDIQATAYHIARSIHPAWDRCSPAAKQLHTRNVFQVLGSDLDTPADRVICWTPNGELIGGTATALRLAQQYNIEIINMGLPDYVKETEHAKENERGSKVAADL